jgi:hypothetical protein
MILLCWTPKQAQDVTSAMSISICISYWFHHTPPCLLRSLDIQRASPSEQRVPLNDNVLSTWVDVSLQELLMRSDGLNSDVASGVNYGVALFLSWSLSICNRGTLHYEN